MMTKRSLCCFFIACFLLCACEENDNPQKEPQDLCPLDPTKTNPGICGCGIPDIFDIVVGDYTCHLTEKTDLCPHDPNKTDPGICGCGTPDDDRNHNGLPDCIDDRLDLCPDDPDKTLPGVCGCGTPDDFDITTGLPKCISDKVDLCPDDPNKTEPGACGCGISDEIDPDTGVPKCLSDKVDLCPNDPDKTLPGVCGCGISDEIDPDTKIPKCISGQVDMCPDDPKKMVPGICGCGTSDDEIDPDTKVPKCISDKVDLCPDDPLKTRPGVCGCGISDEDDSDNDGTPDCIDNCENDPNKTEPGTCGCGIPDSSQNIADNDGDGIPNCIDECPESKWKWTKDNCACGAISYTINDNAICAQIIATPTEFLAFRDGWNDGSINSSVQTTALMLVNDINLGDVMNQEEASNWIGIGTEAHPFDGILIGKKLLSETQDPIVIKAVRMHGKTTETLILGNSEASNVALFGVTKAARIANLSLELSMLGKERVAGLVATAIDSRLSLIQYTSGSISAESMAGGIAATLSGGFIKNATVSSPQTPDDVTITVSSHDVGGIVAIAENAQISNTASYAQLSGQSLVGGIAGELHTTVLSNAFTIAPIEGGSYTAGLVALLNSHSSILNAYSASNVTCNAAPCALLNASIADFSTVKNAYTTGLIINNIPTDDLPPVDPPPEHDTESDEDEEPEAISIPVASLIASFDTQDNVTDKLYYWSQLDIPSIPEQAAQLKYVPAPIPFDYSSLVPSTEAGRLVTMLNENQTCYAEQSCAIEGVSVLNWISTSRLISTPDASQMTVSLPTFDLQAARASEDI